MIFSRALFIMDHADSALFHTLEDTVRVQNARALGIFNDAVGSISHEASEQLIDGDTLGPNLLPLPPQIPATGTEDSDTNLVHRRTGAAASQSLQESKKVIQNVFLTPAHFLVSRTQQHRSGCRVQAQARTPRRQEPSQEKTVWRPEVCQRPCRCT